jgi:DnaJ like chaperone protein
MPWQTLLEKLGSSEGGTLDRLIRAIGAALGLGGRAGVDRAAFTAAVVALSAKLSIADGVALKIEEETFERLFHFDPEEGENVRWLFRLAAKDTAGFESYAREVSGALGDKPELKHDVLEALLHIATADGILHESEERYLASVCAIFGWSPEEWRAMRARFVRDPKDPYEVLGANREMTDSILKTRYRELVRESHPDVLAGRGLSRELQEVAARKIAAINAAWDAISRERGL